MPTESSPGSITPRSVTTDSRRTCLENLWWPITSTLSTSWPRADIRRPRERWLGCSIPGPMTLLAQGACNTAAAFAGGPYTVASAGTVTLNGSATGDVPLTFAWSAPAQGTLSALNIAGPVYTAPSVATTTVVPLQLSVTNCGGTSISNTTVTINAAAAPTVNSLAQVHVFSGAAGSFTVSGTDPNGLALTFNVVQTGAPALLNFVVTQGANPPGTTATATFTAPVLPPGQILDSVINITVTATNSAGATSAPMFTTVCIDPLPDLRHHSGSGVPDQQ